MTDTSVPAASSRAARASPASIERAEAVRLFRDARRLFDLAELVHERRVVGTVDSALLTYRAVGLLLRVLVQLHGSRPSSDFDELAERGLEIVASEKLIADDIGPDIATLKEYRDRLADLGGSITAADERRYDRVLARMIALFDAVRAHLDERLPPQESALARHYKTALAAAVALLLGLLLGRSTTPASVASAPRPAPQQMPAAPIVGFTATFFRDQNLREPAFTRVDPSVAFDWGADAPPGLEQADHFSVRWTAKLNVARAGKYEFWLNSDDGSRLFVDDRLAIDNWGDHSQVTLNATVELTAGVHPIKVEFFDDVGAAIVRLEWSSERFARRLITAGDLR